MIAVVVALSMSLASAACSRGEFRDRTAVVTVDGESTTFSVDSCGLDGTTAFVVGRAGNGDVVQAVVEVRKSDHETGVLSYTGVSVAETDRDLEAFGRGAWTARKEPGDPPGSISSARIRGSRIQVSGTFESTTTADPQANPEQTPVRFSFDARCDQ